MMPRWLKSVRTTVRTSVPDTKVETKRTTKTTKTKVKREADPVKRWIRGEFKYQEKPFGAANFTEYRLLLIDAGTDVYSKRGRNVIDCHVIDGAFLDHAYFWKDGKKHYDYHARGTRMARMLNDLKKTNPEAALFAFELLKTVSRGQWCRAEDLLTKSIADLDA